jgi:hypothetical protein
MSQRNQAILLILLVVVLAALAFRQWAMKAPAPAQNAGPPARASPAGAQPATEAATEPANLAQESGPSAADLGELAGWLDLLNPTGTVIARGSAPVFGLTVKTAPAESKPVVQEAAPTPIPWMTEPGKLDGIVRIGDGPRQALFQGKLYRVGETVSGTTFTLTAVEEDYVTLKCGDHVIWRYWHE